MKPHLYTNVPDYYAIIDDHAHHEHLIRSRKILHAYTHLNMYQLWVASRVDGFTLMGNHGCS